MPRPRTKTDDEVLAAVARVLRARGPHAFTLADVAREAGLSPATLVQRFGTKRGVLVAFARRAAEAVGVEADGPRGLAPLCAHLVALADAMGGREEVANGLSMLLEDVRDPELRGHARAHAERTEDTLALHLEAAMAAGELPASDPRALARVVQAAFNGAIVQWALRGRGRVGEHVGSTLDALFEALAGGVGPASRMRVDPSAR